MIAYDKHSIDSLNIRNLAESWARHSLIDENTRERIFEKYVTRFIHTSLFAKVGQFIFTWISASSVIGVITFFLFLIAGDHSFESVVPYFSMILAGIVTFVLERMIKLENLYKSGTDTALIFLGATVATAGPSILFAIWDLPVPVTLFVSALIYGVYSIRYSDSLTAASAFLLFYWGIYESGSITFLPFLFIILSALIYYAMRYLLQLNEARFWYTQIQLMRLLSLLALYLSGNYFVITHAATGFSGESDLMHQNPVLGIFFYIFTAVVPVIYIISGLRNKDRILLIAGMVLTAISVLTFKYYFGSDHPEIDLTLGGIVLILFAYYAIKYLSEPRYGITSQAEFDFSELEAVTILQSFAKTGAAPDQDGDLKPGDGEFGGGGASGNY